MTDLELIYTEMEKSGSASIRQLGKAIRDAAERRDEGEEQLHASILDDIYGNYGSDS